MLHQYLLCFSLRNEKKMPVFDLCQTVQCALCGNVPCYLWHILMDCGLLGASPQHNTQGCLPSCRTGRLGDLQCISSIHKPFEYIEEHLVERSSNQ
mmetsp:Transcript_4906/g.18442  ORF Transcript_4906/g.18442 Transcript_4906/m.18442 type:complete len:96 (+) Transcript_4906:3147-3434(+)